MNAGRLAMVVLVSAGGCIYPPASGGSDGGSTQNGFGAPALEVTVAGVHYGPAAPGGGSSAALSTNRDSTTGRASSWTFTASATTSSSAGSATCNLALTRQGDDVSALGVGGYTLSADTSGPTPDGLVVPVGGEAVAGGQGVWQCSGAACDGVAFVVTGMDTAHVEGYLGGTLASSGGGGVASVVCAFYLPWSSYSP